MRPGRQNEVGATRNWCSQRDTFWALNVPSPEVLEGDSSRILLNFRGLDSLREFSLPPPRPAHDSLRAGVRPGARALLASP